MVFKNQIYGVISYGDTPVCAGPTAIMDVCKYKTWIEETMATHP